MQEDGIDVSRAMPRQLTQDFCDRADRIILLADDRSHETFPKSMQKQTIHYWFVPNPKDQLYEFHVQIRDEIKRLVQDLIKEQCF